MLMLITITLIISFLVAVNFLLLKFSSNKLQNPSKVSKMPVVLKPEVTIELETEALAPTGS